MKKYVFFLKKQFFCGRIWFVRFAAAAFEGAGGGFCEAQFLAFFPSLLVPLYFLASSASAAARWSSTVKQDISLSSLFYPRASPSMTALFFGKKTLLFETRAFRHIHKYLWKTYFLNIKKIFFVPFLRERRRYAPPPPPA